MYVLGVSDPHCPSAAIIAICELLTVPPSPGLPPVATRYTSALAEGHVYSPVIVNPPLASVVTAGFSNAVAAEPSPVAPTA